MMKNCTLNLVLLISGLLPLLMNPTFAGDPVKVMRISFDKSIQAQLAESILNESTSLIDQKLSGLQIPNLDTKQAIPVPKMFLAIGEEQKKQSGFFGALKQAADSASNAFGYNNLSFHAQNVKINKAKLGNFEIVCEGVNKDECSLEASLDNISLGLGIRVNNQNEIKENEGKGKEVFSLENIDINLGGENCPQKPSIRMKLEIGKDKGPFFRFLNNGVQINIPAGCAQIKVADNDNRKIKEIFTTDSFRPQWKTINNSLSAVSLISPLVKDLVNLIDFEKTFSEVLSNSDQFRTLENRLNKTMVKEITPMINKTIDEDPVLNGGSNIYFPVASFQDYVNKAKTEKILNNLILHYQGENNLKTFKLEGLGEQDLFNLMKHSKDSFLVFSLKEKKQELEEIKEQNSSNKKLGKKIDESIERIEDLIKIIEKQLSEIEKNNKKGKEKDALAKIAVQISNIGNSLNIGVYDNRCTSKDELKKFREKAKKKNQASNERDSQIHGSFNISWFNNLFDQLHQKGVFKFCLKKSNSDLFCDVREENQGGHRTQSNEIEIDLKTAPRIEIDKKGQMKFSVTLLLGGREESLSATLDIKANKKGAIRFSPTVDFKDSLLSDENKNISSKIVDLLMGYVTSSYKIIDFQGLSQLNDSSKQSLENSSATGTEAIEFKIPLLKVKKLNLKENGKIKFEADYETSQINH